MPPMAPLNEPHVLNQVRFNVLIPTRIVDTD